MVGRVIRLSGRTARFIMTPSQRASWLDVNADLPEAQRFASRTGLSWLPVRDPATDDALGVVPVSSLARVSGQGAFCLKDLVQPAPTVIEHTSLADLLDEFRAHPVPLSFVVDEYGSVVGLLSPADLLSVLAASSETCPRILIPAAVPMAHGFCPDVWPWMRSRPGSALFRRRTAPRRRLPVSSSSASAISRKLVRHSAYRAGKSRSCAWTGTALIRCAWSGSSQKRMADASGSRDGFRLGNAMAFC